MTREEGGQTSRHAAGILRVEQVRRVAAKRALAIDDTLAEAHSKLSRQPWRKLEAQIYG